MGRRRDRLNKRLANAITTRRRNSLQKTAECDRRERQILDIIKQEQMPYTPGVMSWLSNKLGKKASRIEAADIKGLLSSS